MERCETPLDIMEWLMSAAVAQSIYVVAKLGIADAVKAGGRTCEELAAEKALDPTTLYRVLRMVVSIGLFNESAGRFTATPVGKYLEADRKGSLHDVAVFAGEKWHLQPWSELLQAVATGECPFERAHDMTFYRFLSLHAEHGEVFDRAMDAIAAGSASAVCAACNLNQDDVVIDVGGGQGRLLSRLLDRFPSARGVLFDLPTVVAEVQPRLAAGRLSQRCTAVSGDCLEFVPAGGHVYLLSRVLHNWGDEQAVQILTNCRQAMARGARVVIVESLVRPEADFWVTWLDLEMLVTCGSRERRVDEYAELLRQAGLHMTEVKNEHASLSVIEAVQAEDGVTVGAC